jgi:hypothetical protein
MVALLFRVQIRQCLIHCAGCRKKVLTAYLNFLTKTLRPAMAWFAAGDEHQKFDLKRAFQRPGKVKERE